MSPPSKPHPWHGQPVALLTQHGKERVVAPRFRNALGLELRVVDDVDTDAFGTFTRDIARVGTQREAARAKARAGAERAGARFGLGSEGAFVPGPFGFGVWDLELVVLVDLERGVEVLGTAHEPGLVVQSEVATLEELERVAERAGFPEHGLVVRTDTTSTAQMAKGLATWPGLVAAFEVSRAASPRGVAWVESDLRAHMHPTRMSVIGRAVDDLVVRLARGCPACGSPGFGVSGLVRGLPCGACGEPTREPVADELACVACDHRSREPRTAAAFADPGACGFCNP